MKGLFLVMIVLCNFVFSIFGSEKVVVIDDKVVITVKLKEVFPRLMYLSRVDIQKLKKFFPEIVHNEPFFAVTDYKSNTNQVQCMMHEGCIFNKDKIETINGYLQAHVLYFPLRYFLLQTNEFKARGKELYSCRRTDRFLEWGADYPNICIDHTYDAVINFDSDIAEKCRPESFIQDFWKSPHYVLKDKQELMDARIIVEENGKIIHGPSSYFAEKIRLSLLYTQLKRFFCGACVVIIGYILYQKFYAAVH